ncbi:MAG: hypothetical protein ABT23_12615 [Thiobacillus sp. SCN 63-57]|nr:MAG: hypothetical protein ABT23_12615 [Thiobacillus sp. SCN 63-57]
MAEWTDVKLTAMTGRIPFLPPIQRLHHRPHGLSRRQAEKEVGLLDHLGASSPSTVLLRCQRREAMV